MITKNGSADRREPKVVDKMHYIMVDVLTFLGRNHDLGINLPAITILLQDGYPLHHCSCMDSKARSCIIFRIICDTFSSTSSTDYFKHTSV